MHLICPHGFYKFLISFSINIVSNSRLGSCSRYWLTNSFSSIPARAYSTIFRPFSVHSNMPIAHCHRAVLPGLCSKLHNCSVATGYKIHKVVFIVNQYSFLPGFKAEAISQFQYKLFQVGDESFFQFIFLYQVCMGQI